MATEQEILQRRLSKFLVGEVFNTISEEDILKEEPGGVWTHKGQPLTPGQIAALKKEAMAFSQTKLFSILMAEIRWHGRNAHNKAVTESDLITANMLGYFADVVEGKLRKIAVL